MKTPPPISWSAAAGLVALGLGLGGCASAPEAGSRPSSAAAEGGGDYGWRDPAFYEPWYDPAVVVLPPPPPGMAASGARAAPGSGDAATLRELDFK